MHFKVSLEIGFHSYFNLKGHHIYIIILKNNASFKMKLRVVGWGWNFFFKFNKGWNNTGNYTSCSPIKLCMIVNIL